MYALVGSGDLPCQFLPFFAFLNLGGLFTLEVLVIFCFFFARLTKRVGCPWSSVRFGTPAFSSSARVPRPRRDQVLDWTRASKRFTAALPIVRCRARMLTAVSARGSADA